MGSSQKGRSSEEWGGDRAGGLAPTPAPLHPHPSFAGSWRSASGRARSATTTTCARCCRCASAADRAPRPPPPSPGRRPPPREPCSAWCRGRPGKPTGRCRCCRASSRLSLASRGVCPAEAASEGSAPLSPNWSPAGDCLGLPAPPGSPSAAGSLPLPPLPALLVCGSGSSVCASPPGSLLQPPGALGLGLEAGHVGPSSEGRRE